MPSRFVTTRHRGAALMACVGAAVAATGCSLEALKTGTPYRPVVTTFEAVPASIHAGAETTLHWDVNAWPHPAVAIDRGIGPVDTYWWVDVAPDATTGYTLTATNDIGTTTATATVTVVPALDHDVLEPNDTFDTATEIELGYTSELLTILPADLDWFTFTLAAPTRVLVDIEAASIGSLLQAVIQILDDERRVLEIFTDGEIFMWDESPHPLDLEAGRYYVLVHGAGSGTAEHRPHRRSGVYTLRLGVVP